MRATFDQEEPLTSGGGNHETERLAALGAAFPAIAHRLGGALNRIALFGQLLEVNLQKGASNDALSANARQIMDGVAQVSLMLKQMQAASRLGGEPVTDLSLSELALTVADQVTSAASERGVGVSVSIDAPCPVRGRAKSLERMIRFLCEHGIEAMSNGGTLTVEVRAAGEQAMLIVRDTCLCVPPELDGLDPLATTQLDVSGLGLAVASHTVLQHGGSIATSPNPGGGMAVTVALPIMERHAAARPPAGRHHPITEGDGGDGDGALRAYDLE